MSVSSVLADDFLFFLLGLLARRFPFLFILFSDINSEISSRNTTSGVGVIAINSNGYRGSISHIWLMASSDQNSFGVTPFCLAIVRRTVESRIYNS